MTQVSDSFFTFEFIPSSPKILLEDYNKRLMRSLTSLIHSVERTLHLEYAQSKTLIEIIETEKQLNQKLYAIHAGLQEAVKQGAAASATQLIRELEHFLKKEEIYSKSFSIHTISSEDWEQQILRDLQAQNCSSSGKLPSLEAVEKIKVESISPSIFTSLGLLQEISSLFYSEFETYTSNLKLFHSDRLVGMTDVRAFGTVYLCMPKGDIPEQVYFCEHIIHEVSHLHLHTLFAIDPLVLNSPHERYTAPIRPDPRPMYGIFHATFVLSRMVKLFLILTEKHGSEFECYFQLFFRRFLNGFNTIEQFGKLTRLGKKIMESYSSLTTLQVATCV